MSNPKIIVVNGLKYIRDENVVETVYYSEDNTVRMTNEDWIKFIKKLKGELEE